jgi:putative ABC transport system ATP-binding protein
MATELIRMEHISRTYFQAGKPLVALHDVSFKVKAGTLQLISGPSGSGKTTLLNIIAGVDNCDSGAYYYENTRIDKLNNQQLALWRRAKVAMIFQDYRLIETLSVYDNLKLALIARHQKLSRQLIIQALTQVDLPQQLGAKAGQLSGGQKQRVAIARALLTQPPLVVADEPAGALDKTNAEIVMKLLSRLTEKGMTVIVVTHDHSGFSNTASGIWLSSGTMGLENGDNDVETTVEESPISHQRRSRRRLFDVSD